MQPIGGHKLGDALVLEERHVSAQHRQQQTAPRKGVDGCTIPVCVSIPAPHVAAVLLPQDIHQAHKAVGVSCRHKRQCHVRKVARRRGQSRRCGTEPRRLDQQVEGVPALAQHQGGQERLHVRPRARHRTGGANEQWRNREHRRTKRKPACLVDGRRVNIVVRVVRFQRRLSPAREPRHLRPACARKRGARPHQFARRCLRHTRAHRSALCEVILHHAMLRDAELDYPLQVRQARGLVQGECRHPTFVVVVAQVGHPVLEERGRRRSVCVRHPCSSRTRLYPRQCATQRCQCRVVAHDAWWLHASNGLLNSLPAHQGARPAKNGPHSTGLAQTQGQLQGAEHVALLKARAPRNVADVNGAAVQVEGSPLACLGCPPNVLHDAVGPPLQDVLCHVEVPAGRTVVVVRHKGQLQHPPRPVAHAVQRLLVPVHASPYHQRNEPVQAPRGRRHTDGEALVVPEDVVVRRVDPGFPENPEQPGLPPHAKVAQGTGGAALCTLPRARVCICART